MYSFKFSPGFGLGDLRKTESWMEIGLAVVAAAFSVAIWLATDSRPGIHFEGATLVTFPTVVVNAPR